MKSFRIYFSGGSSELVTVQTDLLSAYVEWLQVRSKLDYFIGVGDQQQRVVINFNLVSMITDVQKTADFQQQSPALGGRTLQLDHVSDSP